jgi:toxin ParE1/3/4
MEKYKILIFPRAQQDLLEIVEYLNSLTPQAAYKYYDLIINEIKGLSDFPERCPLLKDTQLHLRNYRALRCKNYLVFYTVTGKKVEIRRILYYRRHFESLL